MSYSPTPEQENTEEPPQQDQRHTWQVENKNLGATPPLSPDNEVIMEEAKGGVKRGQARRARGRKTHRQMGEVQGDKEEYPGLAPHQLLRV